MTQKRILLAWPVFQAMYPRPFQSHSSHGSRSHVSGSWPPGLPGRSPGSGEGAARMASTISLPRIEDG